MDIRKQIVLGLLVVSIFIFLVTVLVFVFALYSEGQAVPDVLVPFLEFHMQFMVLMGVFGIFSGLVVFSIMNSTLEKQKHVVKMNIDIIMKFLGHDDREIVALLLSKDGMTTQSEIAKLPGMSRLKAHRIVKKLEDRGLVHVEKYGKINMIRIVDELKNM
ncbi:MAG TPA: winged helix-turn-helix transcriptional regulator [Candidatus Bilamarchaeum sp.]|nr:winged helix-turn-helix transcriptional regulator [Candidatus Bilamarchaeum sp.]